DDRLRRRQRLEALLAKAGDEGRQQAAATEPAASGTGGTRAPGDPQDRPPAAPPGPRTRPDAAGGAPGRGTLNLVAAIRCPSEIQALRSTLESIESVSDPEELRTKIAGLSEKASAPDLWDDPEAAQKVTSALSAAQSELDRVKKLGQRIDDVETLVEMGQEMDDEDTLVEAENEVAAIRKDLDQLEVRTLLAGEYDAREAVVTIRAG